MLDLPVSVARSRLDEIVDDVCARREPVFLTRRGRRVAAVIDADDLERLTQAAEDLADLDAADAGCAEIAEHGTISWEEVKAGLGIEGAVGST
ncbi:type II toxin-antitoxin system Phd/YefM family antitoxin [Actinomyces oris]|uniref:Antitoxin n=1 Tax=Actinomyces oris TaxID=544580 RepID=A0AAW9KZ26_9ACTO|nr:type II toxin-antitoxin system Phd/YefM family antitoxin [Actinomyces oris]MEA1305285.1 type II toxin-antitoxin system Phd/YefM family antitoxin [Actinomyces oris]